MITFFPHYMLHCWNWPIIYFCSNVPKLIKLKHGRKMILKVEWQKLETIYVWWDYNRCLMCKYSFVVLMGQIYNKIMEPLLFAEPYCLWTLWVSWTNEIKRTLIFFLKILLRKFVCDQIISQYQACKRSADYM